MGVAVPLIGVAVSAASTVAGLSAQKKQAEAQKKAIDEQSKGIQSNTALRLMELERQKSYSQYMAQIETARQSQIRMTDDMALQSAIAQDKLQGAQATKQNEESYVLGMYGNDNQATRAELANNTNFNVGNAQLTNQYEVSNDMITNDAAMEQSQLDYQQQGGLQGAEIGKGNAFLQSLGYDQQAINTRFDKSSEANSVEGAANQQGADVLAQVAQAFMSQRNSGKQNRMSAAMQRSQLAAMGGPNSRSDQAQADSGLDPELDQFVQTVMKGGQAADSALAKLGISKSQATALRQLGSVVGDSLEQTGQNARGIASAQAGVESANVNANYGTQANSVAYKKLLSGLDARDKYVLDQLSLSDQHALTKQANNEQYEQNRLGMNSVMAANRLSISDSRKLNDLGYNTYRSSRDASMAIDDTQTRLNANYYDIQNSSAANTIKSDAASQLGALRASRGAIQSPGLLSYASAGFGIAQGAAGAIQGLRSGGQQRQPQQNTGFQSQFSGYSPSQYNSFMMGGTQNRSQNFTGQQNYRVSGGGGVLSSYNQGGY